MTPHQHRLQVDRMKLLLRRVEIAPSVLVAHQEEITKRNAVYLLKGTTTRIRTLHENSKAFTFDNLAEGSIPTRILVVFVKSSAYYGSFTDSPFRFESMSMKRAVLTVGVREYVDEWDFKNNAYAESFLRLIKNLGEPNLRFTSHQYERNSFILCYDLSPDCSRGDVLSPLRNDHIRLSIELEHPLTEPYTAIFIMQQPKALEITATREVFFV